MQEDLNIHTYHLLFCLVVLAVKNSRKPGVKTWKFISHFFNRKSFMYVKGMNIHSEKMPGYKHGNVRNRVLVTLQKLNMAELATIVYLVNRMS